VEEAVTAVWGEAFAEPVDEASVGEGVDGEALDAVRERGEAVGALVAAVDPEGVGVRGLRVLDEASREGDGALEGVR